MLSLTGGDYPVPEKDFPTTEKQFDQFFSGKAECLGYIQKLSWPKKVITWKGRSLATKNISGCPAMPVCPKCSDPVQPRLVDGYLVCRACNKKVPIIYGTFFEKSDKTLQKWFYAIWLVINGDGQLSAFDLKKKLELGCYETALNMLHSIKELMGKEDLVFLPKFKEMYLDILSIDIPCINKLVPVQSIRLLVVYAFQRSIGMELPATKGTNLKLSQVKKLCIIKENNWTSVLKEIFSCNDAIPIHCSEDINKYIMHNNIQDNTRTIGPGIKEPMCSFNKELKNDIEEWINLVPKKNIRDNIFCSIYEFMFKYNYYGIVSKYYHKKYIKISDKERNRIKYLLENKAEEVRHGTMFYRFIQRAVGVPITDYTGRQE